MAGKRAARTATFVAILFGFALMPCVLNTGAIVIAAGIQATRHCRKYQYVNG